MTLVSGGVLGPYLHPRGRAYVARRLAALGVTVLDGPGARVTRVGPDAVELADGRVLTSGVTVWTAGFAVPDLARRSGLRTDAAGRLLTDETLTSVDDARVVAAGDSAAPSGLAFRMSCQAAGPLGVHAADTVLRRVAGEAPRPVALGFVGQCVSLGRHDGVVQLAHRDDTARPLHLGGRDRCQAQGAGLPGDGAAAEVGGAATRHVRGARLGRGPAPGGGGRGGARRRAGRVRRGRGAGARGGR